MFHSLAIGGGGGPIGFPPRLVAVGALSREGPIGFKVAVDCLFEKSVSAHHKLQWKISRYSMVKFENTVR